MIKNDTQKKSLRAYDVYAIITPGYWYVGSTRIGAENRFRQHMKGQSPASGLREKVIELGPDAFELVILETGCLDRHAEGQWYDLGLLKGIGQPINRSRPRNNV